MVEDSSQVGTRAWLGVKRGTRIKEGSRLRVKSSTVESN